MSDALSQYDPIFQSAGREWNVDPFLLKAMAAEESGGKANATSKAGAQGLMQIMPQTQQEIGVANPYDPVQSVYGGAKYMSQALDAEGTPEAALLYYHGGPDWRDKYGPESRGYVPAVTAQYQRIAQTSPVPVAAPTAAAPIAPSAQVAPTYTDFLARSGAAVPTSPTVPQVPAAGAPAPNGGPPPTSDYSGFLSRSGATAAPAIAPAPTQTLAIDPMSGAPYMLDQSGQMQPVPGPVTRIGQAAAQGAVQGYQASPSVLTPAAQTAVDQGGPVGRWLVNPALRAVGGVMGVGNALASGLSGAISQSAAELGVPALGRDVNMLAQVAPAAPMGFMHPALPGVPAAAPTPRFVQEYYGEGLPGNPLASPGAVALANAQRNPLAATIDAPAWVPPGSVVPPPSQPVEAPSFIPPGTKPPPATPVTVPGAAMRSEAPAATAPASVGAAATPDALVDMTPAQVQAYRSTAEGQKLLEAQEPGIPDRSQYIPGVTPNAAEIEQTVNTARELKALNVTAPEVSQESKDIAFANNDARNRYFAGIAGSDVDVANAKAARDAQAETDLAKTWPGAAPADVSPVVDQINSVLTDPQGKQNTQLKMYVQPLLGRLIDENGSPKITDAQELYGFRQDVNRLRQKASPSDLASPESRDLAQISGQLGDVIDVADAAIAKAAPNYANYMANYATASQPIDAMTVLQKFEPKLYDSRNNMSYISVQRMMRNIVDSRQAPGVNPFKSIPDDTMQQLWALRDDLRRSASAQDLASAPGSDTAQNAWDAAKYLGKLGGEAVLHSAANYVSPGLGSMGLNALQNAFAPIFSARTARRQTARGMSLLRPDLGAPNNPLQGP